MIKIPNKVKKVMSILREAGYEAYVVGGCVRDSLLNKAPKDWDICTNATPVQVKDLYDCTYDTGIQHGTITIRVEQENFEITTYRIDSTYSDGRHPDRVVFTPSLTEDLKRRDFTINAMAADIDGNIINYTKDIETKTLRCVGIADHRFKEDALRILRAMRFAAKYGFTIEKGTADAMFKNKELLRFISKERIRDEICEILNGEFFGDILIQFKSIVIQIIPEIDDDDIYEHSVRTVENCGGDLITLKVACFLHDIGEISANEPYEAHADRSFELAKDILKRLRFDNYSIDLITFLVGNHDIWLPYDRVAIKKLMSKYGVNKIWLITRLQMADHPENAEILLEIQELINYIIENDMVFTLKDLAVDGCDMMEKGYKGKAIGNELNRLLNLVMEEKVDNNREELLKLV